MRVSQDAKCENAGKFVYDMKVTHKNEDSVCCYPSNKKQKKNTENSVNETEIFSENRFIVLSLTEL